MFKEKCSIDLSFLPLKTFDLNKSRFLWFCHVCRVCNHKFCYLFRSERKIVCYLFNKSEVKLVQKAFDKCYQQNRQYFSPLRNIFLNPWQIAIIRLNWTISIKIAFSFMIYFRWMFIIGNSLQNMGFWVNKDGAHIVRIEMEREHFKNDGHLKKPLHRIN